jgi:CRISPR-associated protein Csm1
MEKKINNMSQNKATLFILQKAIQILFNWAEVAKVDWTSEWKNEVEIDNNVSEAISRAKELLKWPEKEELKPLKLLFNQINLLTSKSKPKECYWTPQKLNDNEDELLTINYPTSSQPTEKDLNSFKAIICQDINRINFTKEDWENLSLLTLIIEKYGSYISFGDEDIAFIDIVRSTLALAEAIADNPTTEKISLIVGDLSGVQKFIYTISSDGALKSLRARSFYLELITEEIVQQLLEELSLPRTNVIYAGASKLYVLASATKDTEKKVAEIGKKFNRWLLEEFQGKIFLALAQYNFDINKVSSQELANEWSEANKNLDPIRGQKFKEQINNLLKQENAHEPCKVCNRDDLTTDQLKVLNNDEPNSTLACPTCHKMFELGKDLFKVRAIIRSKKELYNQDNLRNIPKITLNFKSLNNSDENIYYYLFEQWQQIGTKPETVLLINDWDLKHYQFNSFKNPISWLLGNYGKEIPISEEENNLDNQSKKNPSKKVAISASQLAKNSDGIKRVGYLRMDVDNLGIIFAKGLGNKQNLPRLAGLSRSMSYFFKPYLTCLAADRNKNIAQLPEQQNIKVALNSKEDKNGNNLLFIYAGGDDLFVSGSWNEVVEFGFDIYQCFRAYTGYNDDITLSAGISLAVPKFPLYQAAKHSGEAEDAAKNNGRDSLTLFGETFKWDEWLGSENLSSTIIEEKDQAYWDKITEENIKSQVPNLLGILPIVAKLNSKQIGQEYARNFVRNLLNVSNAQRQKLEDIEDKEITLNYDHEDIENKKSNLNYKYEDKDIQYYLHLPKIAYTLARLPNEVLDDDDFRKALKSPYNALYYRAIATWIELLNRDN